MIDIKQKGLVGIKWSAVERLLNIILNFAISIIIARILSPSDYGIIGMIAVFTSLSIVFVEGGFSTALIRKLDRDETDFNTVFYYNIFSSILLYVCIYYLAPYISIFYNIPELTIISRVVGLNVIIGAFGTIQTAILTIHIDFKKQAKISSFSLIFSGLLGIFLAYEGFGVWALVFQGLLGTLLRSSLLWYYVGWKPKLIFSISSFKELFGFGSKIMLSGLLDSIFLNLYQIVIGKKYNASQLGFYTRANSLASLPSQNITDIIIRVSYPLLSELQNDKKKLELNYRKTLRMLCYIVFPAMMFLFGFAHPLIQLLLTEKWLQAAPILQILCFSFMFFPINSINKVLFQVKGVSGLLLKIEIVKKSLIVIVLFVSAPFGVLALCYGIVLTTVISIGISTYYTSKLLEITFYSQIKDFISIFLISVLTGIIVLSFSFFLDSSWMIIIFGGISGILFF